MTPDFLYYSGSWTEFVFCELARAAANNAYQAPKYREVFVRVPRGNLGPLGYSEKIEAARRSITELDAPTAPKPDGPFALTVRAYAAYAIFPWGFEFLSHGDRIEPGFVVSDPLSGFWICEAVRYGGQDAPYVATFHYSAKPYFSSTIPTTDVPGAVVFQAAPPRPEPECVNAAVREDFVMRADYVLNAINNALARHQAFSGERSEILLRLKVDLGL